MFSAPLRVGRCTSVAAVIIGLRRQERSQEAPQQPYGSRIVEAVAQRRRREGEGSVTEAAVGSGVPRLQGQRCEGVAQSRVEIPAQSQGGLEVRCATQDSKTVTVVYGKPSPLHCQSAETH